MGISLINSKRRLLLIISILMCNSCMTYKEVTNYYYLDNGATLHIEGSPVSVSGSDAEDSLNGNEGKLSLPLVP